MAMANPLKACVFSGVQARLTLRGEPLRGATVVRRWDWQRAREDRTTTDDDGGFRFGPVFESSVTRLLPVEFVVAQGLYVQVDGEEIKIWSNSKRRPQEDGEFLGRPMVMACELTHAPAVRRDFRTPMHTLCTW